MAQKVLVEILDDIDGSAAAQTVQFGLDGVTYEIDLSDENATALRDEFSRYIGAGRRIAGRRARTAATRPAMTTSDRERNQQIRAWAAANGYEISERGRLSSQVVAAYEQAHTTGDAPTPPRRASRKSAAA